MEKKKYIVEEDKLIALLASYYKLRALESGGVDNWSWYSEACNDWLKSVRPPNLEEDEAWEYGFEEFAKDVIPTIYEEVKND